MKPSVLKFISQPALLFIGSILLLGFVVSCGDKAAYSKGEMVVDGSQSGKAMTAALQSKLSAGNSVNASGPLADANVGLNSAGEKLFLQIQVSSSIDKVSWKTPPGWEEGESVGVRFASFKTSFAADVSLVSFPGEVGGMRANLMRWLGQLKGDAASESQINDYLNALTEKSSDSGLPYVQLDLQRFASANNIVVGIFRFSDNTLFVKMSGDSDTVAKEKETFAEFLRSFSLVK